MEKKFSILLLVTATCMMVQTGCDSTGATFRPNDELFEYTCYAKDSYWVYEDSTTHETDSIAVISQPKKDKTSDEPCNGSDSWVKTFSSLYIYVNHNRFIIDTFLYMPTVYGNFLSENYSRYGAGNLIPADCYYSPNVKTMSMWKCDNNIRIAYAFLYNNTPEPTEYNSYYRNWINFPCYIDFIPHYSIDNNEYKDVKKFMYEEVEFYPNVDTIFVYWAKNIGVIRWECHDTTGSTIMNLVRYDVKNIKKKDLYKR